MSAARRGVLGDRDVWPLVLLYPVILLAQAFQSGLPWRPRGEPPRYLRVVDQMLAGAVPYRDLPLEYPPLALVPWTVPRLFSGDDIHRYAWLLAIQNALLAAGIALCLAWLTRRGWSSAGVTAVLATGALLLLGAGNVVVWLFDLVPALLVGLALVAVTLRRPAVAGLLLGVGTMVKVYPAVIVPVLVIGYLAEGDRRSAGRIVVAAAAAVALVMVPTVLVAGEGARTFLDYQADRGLQLESVAAGVAMLVALLGGPDTTVYQGFGAWQIRGPLTGPLVALSTIAMVVAVGIALASALVRVRWDVRVQGSVTPSSIVACATATILAVMVANKVLSPQFLVWLLPVAALLPRPQALLAAGTSLLTFLLQGNNYSGMMHQRPEMILLLDLRNALLVVLFVWLVLGNLLPDRPRLSGVRAAGPPVRSHP